MENVLKQLELPKEVIEVQDAIQQVAEPESGGLGGGDLPIGTPDLASPTDSAATPTPNGFALPIPSSPL